MSRARPPAKRRGATPAPSGPGWTFTLLTIPSRVEYLARLLQSMAQMPSADRVEVVVVFNAATEEEPLAIEQQGRVPPGIGAGGGAGPWQPLIWLAGAGRWGDQLGRSVRHGFDCVLGAGGGWLWAAHQAHQLRPQAAV